MSIDPLSKKESYVCENNRLHGKRECIRGTFQKFWIEEHKDALKIRFPIITQEYMGQAKENESHESHKRASAFSTP